ncbi:LRP1B [Lepeophtheirus salmonis]|uniref:LRP1B n=1 Tax=Lepeophtheirus salmonis TaxID=72036 RepID=A0A7R8CI81_LEPSM|nr:LRP1B [Lepeophtheirus salmonis]CAF2793177.1 LRP1B [Lepeophtheirus salmonis]
MVSNKKDRNTFIAINFEHDYSESNMEDYTVKLRPQTNENKSSEPLDEFSLSLKFKLYTSTPQTVFSSSNISFWIDSIENQVAVVRFGSKYEYLILHKDFLFPHTWHYLCINKIKLSDQNMSNLQDHHYKFAEHKIRVKITELNDQNKTQRKTCNNMTNSHRDEYSLINHKFNCITPLFTTFSVRGMPPHSLDLIDYKYYLQVIDEEIRLHGVSKNVIKRLSECSSIWILTYTYDPHQIIALYNGTKSYPWGLNPWFFLNGRTYEQMPLKITRCKEDQFSCNEPVCIPLSSVCNDFKDCADAEDEKECITIETLAYRKDFPPPMLQDKKEPISVHIQFHLISINKIDESSGELEIRTVSRDTKCRISENHAKLLMKRRMTPRVCSLLGSLDEINSR